jgi:hypothetical protein
MTDIGGWLADNWFALAGVLVGLLGGWLIALWQREPKRLDFEIVNSVAILTPHAEMIRGSLQVLYDDVPLNDPHIVTIRIVNTGKRAVVRDDFVQPIEIEYENNAPFDGNVVEESHEGLFQPESIFGEDGESVIPSMLPELMNPGDFFAVQLLSDGGPGLIDVRCRFADQARAMRRINHDAIAAEVLKTFEVTASVAPTGRVGLSVGRRK